MAVSKLEHKQLRIKNEFPPYIVKYVAQMYLFTKSLTFCPFLHKFLALRLVV